MRSTIAISVVAAVMAARAPAWALQGAGARAMAEGLFREAKRLMDGGKVEQACRKFEASYAIEATPGTLLNMALCHEREGKTATAWAELNESLALARKAQRGDRVKIIQRHLAEIEPKLSSVVVELPQTGVEALTVTLDAVRIEPGAFGTPIPLDPGEHTLTATQPGKLPWKTQFNIDASENVRQSIPRLADDPNLQDRRADAPAAPAAGGWQRPVGWTAFGLGLLSVGVGSYFGVRTLQLSAEIGEHCDGTACDPQGLAADRDARTTATVADVTLTAGLVTASAGLVLLLVAGSPGAPAHAGRGGREGRGAWVFPVVSPSAVMGAVGGVF